MSEFSENIRLTFDNILKIYQDVATLLRDADALLEQAGYLCFHGSGVYTESSKSLLYPEWWFYQYLLRGYSSESEPLDLRAIGLFFMDNHKRPIDPVLVFGACTLNPTPLEERRYRIIFIRDAWYKSNCEVNQRLKVEGLAGIKHGFIKGIALEQVKDVNALKELVVEPLIHS